MWKCPAGYLTAIFFCIFLFFFLRRLLVLSIHLSFSLLHPLPPSEPPPPHHLHIPPSRPSCTNPTCVRVRVCLHASRLQPAVGRRCCLFYFRISRHQHEKDVHFFFFGLKKKNQFGVLLSFQPALLTKMQLILILPRSCVFFYFGLLPFFFFILREKREKKNYKNRAASV